MDAGIRMSKFTLLLVWVTTTVVCHALEPREVSPDVAVETRVLNEGYSLRLIGVAAASRGEKVDSYKLILRHPDGSEDLVWNPPGTEPNNNSGRPTLTNDVQLFRPSSGCVKDGVLGVLIGFSTWRMDSWWLRWNVREKRMISMVKFFGYGSRDFDFVDGMTIQIDGVIAKLDDQGRVLRKGERYPRAHDVYEGQRRTRYWPIDQENGKIEVTENAQVWPFIAEPVAKKSALSEPTPRAEPSSPQPEQKHDPSGAPAVSQPDAFPAAQRNRLVWPWVLSSAVLVILALIRWKRR